MPILNSRHICAIVIAINQTIPIIIENSYQNTIKEIALFCGNYFVALKNPDFFLDYNFESFIFGSISSEYWISFQNDFLNADQTLLSKIIEVFLFKR